MHVLYLASRDASERDAAYESFPTLLEEHGSGYSAELVRIGGAAELTELGSKLAASVLHLCGEAVRYLPQVAAMGPPALACDNAGEKLPGGIAGRMDPDLFRMIELSESTTADELAARYDELLSSAGLPVPRERPASQPLRIAFVTQEDPFYLPLFFREFFRIGGVRERLSKSVQVAGIMIQRPLGNKTMKGLLKRMWRLYGPVGFVRQGCRYLYTKLAPWRRGVAAEAEHAGVRRIELNDANSGEFVSLVERESIDLVVSVSASQIFKAPILRAPRLGCINLHNAPLPHYRGMLPNFWQMYHDEAESVLTIHYMVEDLDKGDILAQRGTPIDRNMSLEQLIRRTKIRSARTLWNVLDRFAAGAAVATPLPAEEGSYFTWPTAEQAREFRRRGKRLL